MAEPLPCVVFPVLGARLFRMYSAGLGFFLGWLGGDDELPPVKDRGKPAANADASPVLPRKRPRLVGDREIGDGWSCSPRKDFLVGGVSPHEYDPFGPSTPQLISSDACDP